MHLQNMCLSKPIEDEYSWLSWNTIVTPTAPFMFVAEMLPEIGRKEREHIFTMGSTLHHVSLSFQIYSTTLFHSSTRIFWSFSAGISNLIWAIFEKSMVQVQIMQNIELKQLPVNLTSKRRRSTVPLWKAPCGATGNVYLKSFIPCLSSRLIGIRQWLDIGIVQVRRLYI